MTRTAAGEVRLDENCNYGRVGKLLVTIDSPIQVIPHTCIHVSIPNRGRAWTSNAKDLSRRKDFQQEVQLLIPKRARRKLAGELAVRVEIWRRGRAADGDNLQKELFDAFTVAGVWLDDRQVKDCHWTVVEQAPTTKPRVRAEIREWIA